MKYKNIVFDFGNVLAVFEERRILSSFCKEEDMEILSKAVFYNWQILDEGNLAYDAYIRHALSLLPERLSENAYNFFQNWHKMLTPVKEIWALVHELKKLGYKLYILSNAPTHFEEHADYFEIVKEFDGAVFSGSVNMWKPNSDIYQHLFEKYQLNPVDCFFIDDRADNIAAAKSCGMDGIVFNGNVNAIKSALRL